MVATLLLPTALVRAAWLQTLIEGLVSLGYGLLSSLVPIFNSEAWIVATRAGTAGAISVGLGSGAGQALGKVILFLAARHGARWSVIEKMRNRPSKRPKAAWRQRLQSWNDRMLTLIGDDRWGVPILALSALTGFPPVYPMPVVVAPSRMRSWVFCLVISAGMIVRFLVLALLVDGIVSSFW